jgi:PAS domain S-box-containing protein
MDPLGHATAYVQDSVSRSILEHGPDGAFATTPEGEFLSANRALAEIHGYHSVEEFLARMRSGGQPYVDIGRRASFFRELRERGAISRFESQIRRRDGTATWISESARVVRDDAGKIVRCEGVVQDITWRKLTEEVLNQAEEKWRALVESSGEAIVIADTAGVIFFANAQAQASGLGVPGHNVLAEFTEPSRGELREAIARAVRSRQSELLDLERASSGPAAWYEVRVVPIALGGAVERLILIATDITARRQAEEAVRESQRFIGRVADASPAMLYVYDMLTERYVYVNHRVERILGYTAEAFLAGGRELAAELIHAEDASLRLERRRRLADAADDAVVFECILRMRHRRGRWLWMRTREVVFTRGADGHPVQIIGMAEDVTESRRAREELEQSREQLRALSARLEGAREEERAAISRRVHDELGQALTALHWEISWLHHRLAPEGNHSASEVAAKLHGMSGMVETMMHTVRTVASELRPPILDHFGLVAALEWQAQEFQTRYRTTCEVAASHGKSALDRDISTAVFRIFQEILTNIARHAGATKVRVQWKEDAGGLALIVSDNGRGITEGQKSHSLGILGMRERAHLFGGTVEIVGTPGKGTTVTVQIPPGGGGGTPKKETLRTWR